MNDHTADTVGVDISKAHLDAHRLSTGEAARFANDADGFEELAAWVGDPAALVVYESTGPWHRGLEESLAGRLRLARERWSCGSSSRVRRRCATSTSWWRPATRWSKDRTAALNREKQARPAVVRRQHRSRLAQIGRQIKALDAEIAKATAADEELARRNEVLTSIPGIGPAVAATLLADVPELGRVAGKAAASLVGVAPRTRESGQWKGRSFIRGGRAGPRRMLYMAALSAIRHNPDMARRYAGMRDRGKPAKVALTAVVRKLACWPTRC